MALITFRIYATVISNFAAQGDSKLIELTVDDANSDGAISTSEWLSYLNGGTGGNRTGHAAGSTTPAGLYDSGDDGNLASGILYTPRAFADGSDLETLIHAMTRQHYAPQVADLHVCFLAETPVATPKGEVPVESLRAGDLVLTRDHGAQPLVWATSSRVTPEALDRSPDLRPIRIAPGALGDDLPRQVVEVSPQHRVLIRHDGREYLITARHLMRAGYPGLSVRRDDSEFTLFHIAFADHQIVLAGGAPMESFYSGPMAVRALGPAQRLSLLIAFPQVARGENPMTPARPFLRARDYMRMMAGLATV